MSVFTEDDWKNNDMIEGIINQNGTDAPRERTENPRAKTANERIGCSSVHMKNVKSVKGNGKKSTPSIAGKPVKRSRERPKGSGEKKKKNARRAE